jgi:type IV pilus assembly protein PilW
VTLIELMVGMVIGLLATLVITQVAKVFEGQNRSATSGADAQVNGALALQTLQQDLQMAGYGLTSGGVAACTEIRGSAGGVPYNATMAPVVITDGGDDGNGYARPDTVRVLMSSNTGFSLPIRVAEDHRRDGQPYAVQQFVLDPKTNVGNKKGDLMLAVPNLAGAGQVTPAWCSLFNLSADPAGNTLQHAPGADGPWNQDSTATVFPGSRNADVSYSAGSWLVNLGTLTDRTYAISASDGLQVRTFLSATPAAPATEEMFSQIVNVQAVYGKDTSGSRDNVVDAWDNAPPTTADQWSRVVAIRIAVVARNAQYNKDVVTTVPPSWKPDGTTSKTLQVDQNVGGDWSHYRYRVFETVVPLRNMLWQS